MGPALNNLDHLVALPTGCGEQNMVKFAPLVSITSYLMQTNQLSNEKSKTAEEYLKLGMYIELLWM